MACQPVPTRTISSRVTETLQSTSSFTTTITTTIPATTLTSTFTTCLESFTPSGGTAGCASETTSLTTTTIEESTSIRTETITTLAPYTTVRDGPRTTLYSNCPDSGTPTVDTTSTTTTLPNGSVSTIIQTVTTTPPGQGGQSPDLNGGSSGSKSNNVGAIVGGSVGGFLGLLAIIVAFMCWRRSKRWDDIFEKDIGHGIGDDDRNAAQLQPAPYQYGMVGQVTPPLTAQSGGTSPGLAPAQNPHSRVSSFGASAYSRESTVPLTSPISDPGAGYPYPARPTSYPPALIPAQPYPQAPGSPPERPMSAISSTVSSLTPSQMPAGGFYVTNASPEDGSTQRPLSDVIPPSKGEYQSPVPPTSPESGPSAAPVLSEKQQLYQQQQQAAFAGTSQAPSQAGPSGPSAPEDGRFGSRTQEVEMDAPPAYRQ